MSIKIYISFWANYKNLLLKKRIIYIKYIFSFLFFAHFFLFILSFFILLPPGPANGPRLTRIRADLGLNCSVLERLYNAPNPFLFVIFPDFIPLFIFYFSNLFPLKRFGGRTSNWWSFWPAATSCGRKLQDPDFFLYNVFNLFLDLSFLKKMIWKKKTFRKL